MNPNPKSEWNSYFKDNVVLLQINKDVRRLCPDIAFFQVGHLLSLENDKTDSFLESHTVSMSGNSQSGKSSGNASK